MDNKQPKLKDQRLKFLPADKKSLVMGTIIATLIAITPYLFTLYDSVPATKTWDTIFGTYNSGFFENANTAMWIITSKGRAIIFNFYLVFH